MIYVIAPEESSVVKIGHTTVEPSRRVAGLQTGNPERLVLRWSGEGDDKLEKHLHVVFNEYRVQGEWFDLAPLGDPVEAVRGEVEKARDLLSAGGRLFAGDPYRYPIVKAVRQQCNGVPVVVGSDPETPPELRRWGVSMPPQDHRQTWDERFPPVTRPSRVKAQAAEPGCIREWQGKCHRPAGMTCGC